MPTPVMADKAKAEFENGVLKLTLPKAEEARPKSIKISAAKIAERQVGDEVKRRPKWITSTLWGPARRYLTLREAMNRMFEDSVAGSGTPRNGRQVEGTRLPIEAYSTDHDIVVRAAVPGLKPEDVEIIMEGDMLTLRGEFPPPMGNGNNLLAELPVGRFSRTLQLNIPVDAAKAEADI